jgi:hypothetical protein
VQVSVSGVLLRRLRRLQQRLSNDDRPSARPLTPAEWNALTPEEAFSRIYARHLWGGRAGFYSGAGSHEAAVVGPYVRAVRDWAAGQPRMDAVDLGCGDFDVGRVLRPLFVRYTACDVVPALIAQHQAGPDAGDVDFRCLDITRDPLPAGEVAFVRQVLQHLPNRMIQALVPKLSAYRWLVVTEHLPARPDFVPNLDMALGPGTRRDRGASGVDLCAPPFGLRPVETRILCEAPQDGDVIRTTLYRLCA